MVNSDNFKLADTVGNNTNVLDINSFSYGGIIKCKIAAVNTKGNEEPMSDVAMLTTNSSDGNSGQTSDDQAQTPDPTQPSDSDEQTQPTKPKTVKLYLKSFKVVKGMKSFTAKWKKQSKANQKKFNGYQIRYSLKRDMNGARYVTAKKPAKYKKIKSQKADGEELRNRTQQTEP